MRDQRDPSALGTLLLEKREGAPKREKIGATYDRHHLEMLHVPDFDPINDLAVETAAAYAAEFPDGLPTLDDIDPSGD